MHLFLDSGEWLGEPIWSFEKDGCGIVGASGGAGGDGRWVRAGVGEEKDLDVCHNFFSGKAVGLGLTPCHQKTSSFGNE